MKTNPLRIVALSIVASILLVPTLQSSTVFAADPVLSTGTTGGVQILAVFHFGTGDESIGTFKVFNTENGVLDRAKAPSFRLEGVVGWDRPLLYKAIGDYYVYDKTLRTDFTSFDVDVIFHKAGKPLRQISYDDCLVSFYDVQTITDGEESYALKTDFVYIDLVRFQCEGLHPKNPVYQSMKQSEEERITAEARANLDQSKETKKSNEALVAQYILEQNQLQTFTVSGQSTHVPTWVKQNAKWVAEGKISAQEYSTLLQYVISKGILKS